MKLRTRLSLLTAVLSAIPTFALGGVAVNNAQAKRKSTSILKYRRNKKN